MAIGNKIPEGRQALIGLSNDMLSLNATQYLEDGSTIITLAVDADPIEVERELRASPLKRVLLGKGDSLLGPCDGPAEQARDLTIGNIHPGAVDVTALSRSWTSAPPQIASDEQVHYMRRWIAIGLWYGEKTNDQRGEAVQRVGGGFQFNTYHDQADETISRIVFRGHAAMNSPLYGHSQKERATNDKKLLSLTNTVERLFELRLTDETN